MEVFDLHTGEQIDVSKEEQALIDYIGARPVHTCFQCEELIPTYGAWTCRHCLQDFDEACFRIHRLQDPLG